MVCSRDTRRLKRSAAQGEAPVLVRGVEVAREPAVAQAVVVAALGAELVAEDDDLHVEAGGGEPVVEVPAVDADVVALAEARQARLRVLERRILVGARAEDRHLDERAAAG